MASLYAAECRQLLLAELPDVLVRSFVVDGRQARVLRLAVGLGIGPSHALPDADVLLDVCRSVQRVNTGDVLLIRRARLTQRILAEVAIAASGLVVPSTLPGKRSRSYGRVDAVITSNLSKKGYATQATGGVLCTYPPRMSSST